MASEHKIGDNIDDSQKKVAFTRVSAAYILFNAVLFLPGLIFRTSDAVKVHLNLEVVILFALWAIFGKRWGKRRLQWYAAGFSLLYVIVLAYKLYASIMSGLYQREANFFNNSSFISGNVSFLLEAMNLPLWVYLAGAAAIIALIGLILWGARAAFVGVPVSALEGATRSGLITLGLVAVLVGGLFPKRTANLQIPLSSLIAELTANIHRSIESRENLKEFVTIDPSETYDYAQYPLSETPDVYFIFVESYGSVVYTQPHFTAPYLEMVETLEKNLTNDGWSAVSTLSEAPVWGGGSWMSYTSALFGLSIEQQVEYDALKEKFAALEYPNIGRYFSSQGYDYVWVVPINRRFPEEREAIEQNFYGADRWITFDTLKYEGPMLGWGPSVPDQYTLGFTQEFVSQQEQPTFLFYLTQNLHYPWTPLPPIVNDWRELGNLPDSVLNEEQQKGLSWDENYLHALDNTIYSLEEFITSIENENSVVVLIGDHQPPAVSRHEDGFGTMVHIISQDVDLLESYREYGFVDGLVLENLAPSIRHEGLYSLFVRNFVAQYGESPWDTPSYLPNGNQ